MFETGFGDLKSRLDAEGIRPGAMLRRRDGKGEPFRLGHVGEGRNGGKAYRYTGSRYDLYNMGYIHNFMIDDGKKTNLVKPKDGMRVVRGAFSPGGDW